MDERIVTLIDTPGFDDTKLSDTSVLNMIAAYFSHSWVHQKNNINVVNSIEITSDTIMEKNWPVLFICTVFSTIG